MHPLPAYIVITARSRNRDYLYAASSGAAAGDAVSVNAGSLQPELFHAARAAAGRFLLDARWFWFTGVLQLDFGVSSINGQSINLQLHEVFPATLELCIPAFSPALLLGIPLGIIAGVMRNKWQDRAIGASALLGFSMPVFWLALLLTLFSRSTLAGCR